MMAKHKTYLVLALILLLIVPSSSFASHGATKIPKLIGVDLKGKTSIKVSNPPLSEENTKQINIKKFEKYDTKYLIFWGTGVRGLHNIVIKIQGDEFETKITTKSTDKGSFYVPWEIPKIKSGIYTITVSDKLTTITTSFKI